MENPVYIIKNGQLVKVGGVEAQLFVGDLIERNSKFYKVVHRVMRAKTDNNEMAYIVEEFNPLT
jgi:hypothetical protein